MNVRLAVVTLLAALLLTLPGSGIVLASEWAIIGDLDADGVEDFRDNCPHVPNPLQTDTDLDGWGDACDEETPPPDGDLDGIADSMDDCPAENAAGFDANANGCLDDAADIRQEIHGGVLDGVVSVRAERHLIRTLDAAEASLSRGNPCAALGQLRALNNQIQTMNDGLSGPELHNVLMQMIANFILRDVDKGFCLGKSLAG